MSNLSPAKKRALKAQRRRMIISILAGIPAVVYVVYRVITFVNTL